MFSGEFDDLTNVPVNLDLDVTDDFSGDYNDLSNQPWSFDGVNAYRTSGFTGIGLATPEAMLRAVLAPSK